MVHGYRAYGDGEQRCGLRSAVGFYWREGDGYPSDPTDVEWPRLEPLIPEAAPGGRSRKTDMWAAMNAILYLRRVSDTGRLMIYPPVLMAGVRKPAHEDQFPWPRPNGR